MLDKKYSLIIMSVVICFLNFYSIIQAQEMEEKELEFDFVNIDNIEASTKISEKKEPRISSPSAVAIDTENGRILYQKNAFTKRQMASTTKMMTAIIAIETANLYDIVTVSRKAASVGGSQAHLKVGEKITLYNLLYALMLPSGNDAAIAIAEHISGSVEEFIKIMDQKALEIGAMNTKYGSPHGLDRNNYSTAYDLALIARYCLKNEIFAKIVSTKSKVIPREGNPSGSKYNNTNKLLDSYPGADGVKTGYTGPAGRCLVTSATRDQWQIVSVVLGSNSSYSRWKDSRDILDYVFENYPLHTIVKDGEDMIHISVKKGKKDIVHLINGNEIKVHINENELNKIEKHFYIPEEIQAPVEEGEILGKVAITLDGHTIGESDLKVKEPVEFWTINMNLYKILKGWLKLFYIE